MSSTSHPSSSMIRPMLVGKEREPVIVIDRATGQVEALTRFAAERSAFEEASAVGSAYPGLLGTAPRTYVEALVAMALPLIGQYFGGADVQPSRARGNFSLVTTAPGALSGDQSVPHVDAPDRMQFALVHYLSGSADGTGFFRHRATGFETIDATRLSAYNAARDAEAAGAAAYVTSDHPLFEQTAAVAGHADRIILYRAALLHSALISRLPERAADPRKGRLTGNLFLHCRAKG